MSWKGLENVVKKYMLYHVCFITKYSDDQKTWKTKLACKNSKG